MKPETTYDAHLDWCKKRAHELAEGGAFTEAVTGMMNDLSRFEGTKHLAVPHKLADGTKCKTQREVDGWINSFE